MKEKIKTNFTYLFLFFFLSYLTFFCIKILTFLWDSIGSAKQSQIYLDSVWFLGVICIVVVFIKRKGINPIVFLTYLVAFGLIAYFITVILSFITRFDKLEIITRNYIGTYGVSEESSSSGEGTITAHKKTFVFNITDDRYKKEILELSENFNEGADSKKFIFWQTALANGFTPKYIKRYECCGNFSNHLELYLTVGPLAIIECLINSLTSAFLLLFLPLIGLLFNKKLFFSDYQSLLDIFKRLENSMSSGR